MPSVIDPDAKPAPPCAREGGAEPGLVRQPGEHVLLLARAAARPCTNDAAPGHHNDLAGGRQRLRRAASAPPRSAARMSSFSVPEM
jgi:hypothetical protein